MEGFYIPDPDGNLCSTMGLTKDILYRFNWFIDEDEMRGYGSPASVICHLLGFINYSFLLGLTLDLMWKYPFVKRTVVKCLKTVLMAFLSFIEHVKMKIQLFNSELNSWNSVPKERKPKPIKPPKQRNIIDKVVKAEHFRMYCCQGSKEELKRVLGKNQAIKNF